MTGGMAYRGDHRKYAPGSSAYEIYYYGDVVGRDGKFWVCGVTQSYGYLPSESASGFTLMSLSVDPSPNPTFIDGGTI
jgi:hypothetical protein